MRKATAKRIISQRGTDARAMARATRPAIIRRLTIQRGIEAKANKARMIRRIISQSGSLFRESSSAALIVGSGAGVAVAVGVTGDR